MKLSTGWQEIMIYKGIRNSYPVITFMSGDTLSSEELISFADANVYQSDLFIGRNVQSVLAARGRTPLCYLSLPSSSPKYVLDSEKKMNFSLELAEVTTKVAHYADGIIGSAYMSFSNYPPEHPSHLSKGLVFMSVGLPGSGADIELTSVDYANGDDIRMNNLAIKANI